MNTSEKIAYPGDSASLKDIFALADEYNVAAYTLKKQGRRGNPLSRAPGRMCAVHAIELYLNAFLMHHGVGQKEIRSIFHNLAVRADRAKDKGLNLKKNTFSHLATMTEVREYLIVRYGPEKADQVSELNRLFSTLDEVCKKVRTSIENDAKILG